MSAGNNVVEDAKKIFPALTANGHRHGYEAKREIIAASYNTSSTVFYEIKRWINSLDTLEEVTDGRETAQITRREILKDYLTATNNFGWWFETSRKEIFKSVVEAIDANREIIAPTEVSISKKKSSTKAQEQVSTIFIDDD